MENIIILRTNAEITEKSQTTMTITKTNLNLDL